MCSEYTNFCHAFCFILARALLLQLVAVLFLFFHSPSQPFLIELLLIAPNNLGFHLSCAIYCARKIIFLLNGSKYHQKLIGTTGNKCSGPLFWHKRWSCSGFRTRWSLEKSIFFHLIMGPKVILIFWSLLWLVLAVLHFRRWANAPCAARLVPWYYFPITNEETYLAKVVQSQTWEQCERFLAN